MPGINSISPSSINPKKSSNFNNQLPDNTFLNTLSNLINNAMDAKGSQNQENTPQNKDSNLY
ncbi:hypothetical protein ACFL2K_04455 [Candidatus Margulisiibacteriota bacterium]